jgi:hypothetical protein
VSQPVAVKVSICARCGGDHLIEAKPFTFPSVIGSVRVTHWFMCPVREEPVLVWATEAPVAAEG